jgi:hypothetical protein
MGVSAHYIVPSRDEDDAFTETVYPTVALPVPDPSVVMLIQSTELAASLSQVVEPAVTWTATFPPEALMRAPVEANENVHGGPCASVNVRFRR